LILLHSNKMIKYNKILVLENDSNIVPSYLSNVLNKEQVNIEYWYDFSISFHWDEEKAFKRLMSVSDDTLLVCSPSFVGAGNSFDGYLMVFLKLKDLGKNINIAVLYPDNFYVYLLKFLSDHNTNTLKRKNNLRILKEVLDFHNLYEITYSTKFDENINESVHITFDYLMLNYFETNKQVGKTKCKIISTGEEFEVYSIYYKDPLEESEIVLYIEDKPNNKYSLKEITK
jgi:hypothetical protein